jgi:serine/threonine-protein kinase
LDETNGHDVTLGFESTSPGRVLDSLARSIGSIPRVLLPDTHDDDCGVSVIMPSSSEMPAAAERGGRYQLLGEIARGGMGAVLKGRDPDLGRDLAVKVLLEGHRDKPDLLRRFVEEAQIGGQLQHPGIVPVYELGTFADSRPYFTMKLVKGRTLSQLLKERPSPFHELPRFLGIFEQVCQTMAYAHARGVIHRDLKPTNIMVGSFGEVQVMDWGLAKVLKEGGIADEPPVTDEPAPAVSVIQTVRSGSGVDISLAGSALGTPAYMAPEQAGGDIEHVDRRADVFGLGSILCEILTGQPAYTARTQPEVMRKAMRGDTSDAMARLDRCGADGELTGLARECLAAEAEDRPREAGLVAARVAAYIAGVQERLRKAELAKAEADARAEGERKRRRLALALAASIVLLAASAVGGWAWVSARRERLERQIGAALDQASALRARALATPSDPGLWTASREQTHRAAALAEVGPVDPALRDRVRALEEALDQDRKDQAFLAAIDKAQFAGNPNQAFADYGVEAGQVDVKAIAARIQSRPVQVRDAFVAGLDMWLRREISRRLRDPKAEVSDTENWLKGLIAAVDEDPWRRQAREAFALADGDPKRALLTRLADEADVARQPTQALLYVLQGLASLRDKERAITFLRRAQFRRPGDPLLYSWLSAFLESEEAVRYAIAGVALRPDSGIMRNSLGWTLGKLGLVDEAMAHVREAIRLEPDLGAAHDSLGYLLLKAGRIEDAFDAYSKAARCTPWDPVIRSGFARYLIEMGRMDEGIDVLRQMSGRRPDDARPHAAIAEVVGGTGRLDEAVAELRKAISLDLHDAHTHRLLASYLTRKRVYDEAIAEGRKAVALEAGNNFHHLTLALALREKGDYQAAIAEFGIAGELTRLAATHPDSSAKEIAETQRLAKLADRLPGILRGRDQPGDASERIALAGLATNRGLYAAAARLYGEAIDPGAKPDDDAQHQARYHGAVMAVLASCGQGRDDPRPDEAARVELRRRALGWLRASLAVETTNLAKVAPEARRTKALALVNWTNDPDLAGVRDTEALTKLQAQEQKAWRDLWGQVHTLLKKAQGTD